jgi:allophanate hydrolase
MKAVALDPIGKNSELGRFTNFVNFLGQAAVACPSGITSSGLPFGVTFIAPNGYDRALLELAHLWERDWAHTLGSTGRTVSSAEVILSVAAPQPHSAPTLLLAVVGAHLSGMPLNGQLIERGARLVSTTRTSAHYQLYELAATSPRKPGLFRTQEGGVNIELEVYEMALSQLGSFLTLIPAPLGLGQVELESGQWVHGFICEAVAQSSAKNISEHGGWRHYLSSLHA